MKKLISNNKIFAAIILTLFSLLSSSSWAKQSPPSFELDSDYKLITKQTTTNAEQLSDLETINNIEFFYWFGCDSCYQVEAALVEFSKTNPEVSIRRTPLVMMTSWREQAYIQAILEQLSGYRVPAMLEIYQQCLTDCSVFNQFESSQSWLLDKLVTDELPSIVQVEVWQTEKNFEKRADLFSISQVPTIIINEKYQVDAKQAKTTRRMIEIIAFLLQKSDNSQP